MSDWGRYIPEGYKPHASPVAEVFYGAQADMISPPQGTPLKRFPTLNRMIGGFRPKEFTILCGGTGTGKTTLCANLSADLLEQGVPHFVASVETGHHDYVRRMISALAGYDWNTGDRVNMDMLKLFNAEHGDKFRAPNFWLSLYEDRTTVETLMADLAYMVKEHKTKLAIIDNLNFFLEITSAQNALIEMDRVIHELIIFCKQVPIHIVMIMHPKKSQGTSTRVESEYDIKGSSTAVQEAHNVLLWNRVHPDLIESGTAADGDRELMIAKMRRNGKFVYRRLVMKHKQGVQYFEGALV